MGRVGYKPEFLSPLDVAELVSLSRKTVYDAIHTGTLKATKVGRQWRIHINDYEAWAKVDEGEAWPARQS